MGQTYYYKVVAVDFAGNVSPDSAVANCTVLSGLPADERIENSDPRVSYTSGWWLVSSGQYGTLTSGGSLMYATSGTSAIANVSSATLTFNGRYATWIGVRAANRGIAGVYVDGVFQRNVDCYQAGDTVWQAPMYTTPLLAEGPHTLKIVYTGSKNPAATGNNAVDVDAFDVWH
jgi:hypothetical protein